MFKYIVIIGLIALCHSVFGDGIYQFGAIVDEDDDEPGMTDAEFEEMIKNTPDWSKCERRYPLDTVCAEKYGVVDNDMNIYADEDVPSLFEGKLLDYTFCVANKTHLVNNDGVLDKVNVTNAVKNFTYLCDERFLQKVDPCLSLKGANNKDTFKEVMKCLVTEMRNFNLVKSGDVSIPNALIKAMDEYHSILLRKPQPRNWDNDNC